ncbi:MAG: membrane protein insertion efficiency factor YidD [Patescibacteria group bacterium]|nr:membrane protein insertion efficiency factor YidD [Patescibacteria group bacterium]
MKYFILGAITIYQNIFSPDHGWLSGRHPFGYCRFYPSCSEYTFQAVEKFGVIQGSYLAIRRVLSCNPFSPPAYKPFFGPPTRH